MREGTQLGVAKAARFPPCTLLYVGRRFIIYTVRYCFSLLFISLQEKQSNERLLLHIVFPHGVRDLPSLFEEEHVCLNYKSATSLSNTWPRTL